MVHLQLWCSHLSRRFYLLLVKHLNQHTELVFTEKVQSPLEQLITGIKINLTSEDCHWKVIAQPKPKVYLLKITLVNINEEVKGVNWIQLNKLNQFEFPHHSHNQANISTL